MNDDAITDLKQFIAATITQQTSDIRQDISGIKQDIVELRRDVAKIDKKVDDLSAFVADAMDASNEESQAQLKDHEGAHNAAWA